MRVTFIIKNLTEGALAELAALSHADRYRQLLDWSLRDLRHCVSQKVGSSHSFRDRVELNAIMRAPHWASYKIEPRKGYRLATFEIEKK